MLSCIEMIGLARLSSPHMSPTLSLLILSTPTDSLRFGRLVYPTDGAGNGCQAKILLEFTVYNEARSSSHVATTAAWCRLRASGKPGSHPKVKLLFVVKLVLGWSG